MAAVVVIIAAWGFWVEGSVVEVSRVARARFKRVARSCLNQSGCMTLVFAFTGARLSLEVNDTVDIVKAASKILTYL